VSKDITQPIDESWHYLDQYPDCELPTYEFSDLPMTQPGWGEYSILCAMRRLGNDGKEYTWVSPMWSRKNKGFQLGDECPEYFRPPLFKTKYAQVYAWRYIVPAPPLPPPD